MIQEQPVKPTKPVNRGPISIATGATYPLRALGFFGKHPQLRNYIFVPILVNLVVGGTVYAGLLYAGFQAIDAILASISHLVTTAHLPDAFSVALPEIGRMLPAWHLPDLTGVLPDWQTSLPHWQIHFPDWHITLPNITLPDWLSRVPGSLADFFLGLIRVVLSAVLLLFTGFIFLQFGVLLGAPWYGKLSEEVEKIRTGSLRLIEVNPVQEVWRAIEYELKKLVLTIAIGVPLLLLNFFPGVGTAIATIGGITLGSTIVCLDFFDAAVERRRPRFRQKLGVVWRSLPASAGFAVICFALVSVPLVNLLAIPVCVAAGTLFFCDRVKPWFDSDVKKT
jgi:CysZ protein